MYCLSQTLNDQNYYQYQILEEIQQIIKNHPLQGLPPILENNAKNLESAEFIDMLININTDRSYLTQDKHSKDQTRDLNVAVCYQAKKQHYF